MGIIILLAAVNVSHYLHIPPLLLAFRQESYLGDFSHMRGETTKANFIYHSQKSIYGIIILNLISKVFLLRRNP